MQISTRLANQTATPADDAALTYVLAEDRGWLDVVSVCVVAGLALLAAATVETWWLWVLAGWTAFVALVAVGAATRRGRVERVVETH
jgi:hypothetical protein